MLVRKYTSENKETENTNRKIQVVKAQVGKYTSENTNRKIQIGKYKSENGIRKI